MQNLELSLPESGLVLSVREFRVEERMNRPFEIHLTVRSDDLLDLADIIGKRARFVAAVADTEADLAERCGLSGPGYVADWCGLVADIEEFGTETAGVCLYRVHVVHPLWVLGQNKNYRIFQHLSEFDMARALCAEWKIEDNVLCDATEYKRRDYRIQYGESDLDFIHRNLEDLGISYYIEDTGGTEVVTFSAAPERRAPRPDSLRYHDEPPRGAREPWATAVAVRRVVRAAKYTLQDVDYRFPPERQPRISSELVAKPNADLPVTHRVSAVERSLETYEYNPGIFCVERPGAGDTPVHDRKLATRTDDKYGRWLTEVRLRSIQASRYRIHFQTNAFDLHPGKVARIVDHLRPELADPVLVIEVTFTGSDTGEWSMSCTAHPTNVPYIPELVTPRPCASGVETATVVGVPGKRIDPQELGSVLVQFHWDRESQRNDDSSCWVPVSYGLAGPGRGMFCLPRLGEEVLVDFLAGDLDKPVVTGRVYTGLNKPWTKEVDKMGDFSIKNDSLDDPCQNTGVHLTADGKPLMHLWSTNDKQVTVGNDERATVARNRSRKVGGGETVHIVRNQNVTIKQSFNQRVMGGSTTTVDDDIFLVSRESTIGLKSATSINLKAGMFAAEATKKFVITCGGSTIVLVPNGIVINSPKTFINPGQAAAQTAIECRMVPAPAAK